MVSTILVIDDDPTLITALAGVLELGGYNVVTTDSGIDGIGIATNMLPDLIICDYKMPEINGSEVIIAIRENQDTANIPIILATGYIESELNDIPDNVSTIAKPFDIVNLLSSVKDRLPATCA